MVYLFVMVAIIVLDLKTKKIVSEKCKVGEHIEVLKNRIYISHMKNKGAALGFLRNNRGLLMCLSLSLVFVNLVAFIKLLKISTGKVNKLSFSFILGGAFGNLYERLFKGEVTDFIDLNSRNSKSSIPVFNFADLFIFIGASIQLIKNLIK